MNEALLYILGIVIVVIGLALSIGLHEFGHLIPAKLFGVKVPHWAIGFGPKLWKKKILQSWNVVDKLSNSSSNSEVDE